MTEDDLARIAEARAASPGKEPFSRDAFEDAMALFGEARESRSQVEYDQIERNYYLLHPDVKTMRELATIVTGADIARGAPMQPAPAPPDADCPLCNGDAYATGATKLDDGRTMREVECSSCHYRYFTWRAVWGS